MSKSDHVRWWLQFVVAAVGAIFAGIPAMPQVKQGTFSIALVVFLATAFLTIFSAGVLAVSYFSARSKEPDTPSDPRLVERFLSRPMNEQYVLSEIIKRDGMLEGHIRDYCEKQGFNVPDVNKIQNETAWLSRDQEGQWRVKESISKTLQTRQAIIRRDLS